LVNDPNDYLYVPLITSIAALITGLLGLYIVYRKFSIGFVIQTYTDIQQQLRAGWNVFVSIVAINTYTATRIFAVGLLTNNTVTGYYAIAERIAGIIQSFPLMSFSQAVYPRLSKIYLQNKRRAMRIMYHVQRITTVTYIVLGFPLFFITAPWLIRLICGIEYPDVVMAMRLLLLSIFFITGNAFRVQFLLVSGRAKLFARIHVIMAALSLGLLFLLTYVFSYRGTAYSAIITEAGIFLLTWKAMKELAEL
jgi:PST family polysaccharide transporter